MRLLVVLFDEYIPLFSKLRFETLVLILLTAKEKPELHLHMSNKCIEIDFVQESNAPMRVWHALQYIISCCLCQTPIKAIYCLSMPRFTNVSVIASQNKDICE